MALSLLFLVGLIPSVLSTNLYATHYSGTVSVLSLTTSGSSYNLNTVSTLKACGSQPSWLTFDWSKRVLYCSDESGSGGTLTAFNVAYGGALTQTSKVGGVNSGVHSTLYGNGNNFIAIAS